ncbi:hypothetical protein Tco_0786457 [Tanacetum coccineum]
MRDNPQLQQEDLLIWLTLKYKFESIDMFNTSCRPSAVRLRDQDNPHDDAHPEGECHTPSAKRNFSPTISTKAHSSRSKLPRDPKAHALSIVNQYLLYLKKGNLRPEKIALSLHKFPAVIFPDDIKERTSRWAGYSDLERGIEKYKVFSIVSKPVYGIIYTNSKKEKRVMRH